MPRQQVVYLPATTTSSTTASTTQTPRTHLPVMPTSQTHTDVISTQTPSYIVFSSPSPTIMDTAAVGWIPFTVAVSFMIVILLLGYLLWVVMRNRNVISRRVHCIARSFSQPLNTIINNETPPDINNETPPDINNEPPPDINNESDVPGPFPLDYNPHEEEQSSGRVPIVVIRFRPVED